MFRAALMRMKSHQKAYREDPVPLHLTSEQELLKKRKRLMLSLES